MKPNSPTTTVPLQQSETCCVYFFFYLKKKLSPMWYRGIFFTFIRYFLCLIQTNEKKKKREKKGKCTQCTRTTPIVGHPFWNLAEILRSYQFVSVGRWVRSGRNYSGTDRKETKNNNRKPRKETDHRRPYVTPYYIVVCAQLGSSGQLSRVSEAINHSAGQPH